MALVVMDWMPFCHQLHSNFVKAFMETWLSVCQGLVKEGQLLLLRLLYSCLVIVLMLLLLLETMQSVQSPPVLT